MSTDFDQLFDAWYGPLFRFCDRTTGDPDRAEDVAQEAFVRLYERGVVGTREALRVWLFRTATNLMRDEFRTARSRRTLLARYPAAAAPRQPVSDQEFEWDQLAAARRALSGLNERDRRILLLKEEGFSYREIAELLEVAPTSVGALILRARRRFERAYRGIEESA